MKKACGALLVALVVMGAGLALASGPPKLDPALPTYQPASGVSGNVSSVGSDTLTTS